MRTHHIPDSDLHLVTELLETIDRHEVAQKWEVGACTLAKYLKRHDTSVVKIREDYYLKMRLKLKAEGKKEGEIAKYLGISRCHLARIRKKRLDEKMLKEAS